MVLPLLIGAGIIATGLGVGLGYGLSHKKEQRIIKQTVLQTQIKNDEIIIGSHSVVKNIVFKDEMKQESNIQAKQENNKGINDLILYGAIGTGAYILLKNKR